MLPRERTDWTPRSTTNEPDIMRETGRPPTAGTWVSLDAKRLGHANISITLNIYRHLYTDELAVASLTAITNPPSDSTNDSG